jgi:hypothetical protein
LPQDFAALAVHVFYPLLDLSAQVLPAPTIFPVMASPTVWDGLMPPKTIFS